MLREFVMAQLLVLSLKQSLRLVKWQLSEVQNNVAFLYQHRYSRPPNSLCMGMERKSLMFEFNLYATDTLGNCAKMLFWCHTGKS